MMCPESARTSVIATVVAPPFLLYFAAAYLDAAPEFPEEVWEDWAAEKESQFGERWPTVQTLLAALQARACSWWTRRRTTCGSSR